MSEETPKKIKEVLEKLNVEKPFDPVKFTKPLPKCEMCGSQLRKDDKCICGAEQ